MPQQPPRTDDGAQERAQRAVLGAERRGVALVELLGLVELGVALGRRVGAQAADALAPGAVLVEHAGEVRRVRAVDHEVGDRAVGLGVDALDGVAQRLAVGQAPVGLQREGDHRRQAVVAGGAGDADRLVGVGHGDAR